MLLFLFLRTLQMSSCLLNVLRQQFYTQQPLVFVCFVFQLSTEGRSLNLNLEEIHSSLVSASLTCYLFPPTAADVSGAVMYEQTRPHQRRGRRSRAAQNVSVCRLWLGAPDSLL